MTTAITRPQLEVLKAASRGEVSKPAPGQGYDIGTWRVGATLSALEASRAVTGTVESLIRRGAARESAEIVDNRQPLVVTADGYELLSKAASRVR